MSLWRNDPLMPISLVAGVSGALLMVHAHLQSKLLYRRIASGASTRVVDPNTGLFCVEATWQCIRAEANRAQRLGRPLDVWIGTARDTFFLDDHGREMLFDMPRGAMGIRLDTQRICFLSCTGADIDFLCEYKEMSWKSLRILPTQNTTQHAFDFVTGAANA